MESQLQRRKAEPRTAHSVQGNLADWTGRKEPQLAGYRRGAPLLTLFGEQVALQFLSHSTSWIENFIFACAPIGILTSVVSAIRVGGSRWLKAVIGRAREPEASAELELMSSTSSDICELWNGVGIVRVVGTPSMLELIYRVDSTDNVDGNSSAEVYTLDTAIAKNLYILKSGDAGNSRRGSESGSSSGEPRLPPNLFLNISGGTVPTWELVLVAVIGATLQLGIFVYDGLITVPSKMRLMFGVPSYAFPFTIVGTVGMTLGAYICAYVVEASTDEEVWEAADTNRSPFQIVWLQRGQIVGDQVFKSFAIYNTPNQQVIRTSRKTKKLERLEIPTLLGTILCVICFVLQFIGLRAMHWSAAVAQLLATGIMVVLRVAIRRNLSMVPKARELPAGFELDTMAKIINKCEDGKILVSPRLEKRDSAVASCLASRVLRTRIRLAELAGWPSIFPETVDQVVRSIQAIMNHLFRPTGDIVIKRDFQQMGEFTWDLPISVQKSPSSVTEDAVLKIILRRRKVDDKWTAWEVKREEVEAVLSLWMSHFPRASSSEAVHNLWILGPDSTFNRIVYDWWIYRGTQKYQIRDLNSFRLKFNMDEMRVFHLQGLQATERGSNGETDGLLGVVTRATLQRTCGQYLLASFLKNVTRIIDKLEGKTHVTPGLGANLFTLVEDSIRGIAEAVQQSGLVSTEDAYRLLIPPLCSANKLQDPSDILEDVINALRSQIYPDDQWTQQPLSRDTFGKLVYLCNRKAKLLGNEERWADAGRTFMQLIQVLSNALGSYDESTIKAREAMKQFAADFVQSRYGTGPGHHEVRQKPFRLHAAAAKGYLDLVLEALEEGVGVDTWDDEHETPISLAIKNGHLDTARLLIFYGAPVDPEAHHITVNRNRNGLYPMDDTMVNILLLNLANKTQLLLEASEKGYHVMMKLLLSIGIDTTVRDSHGFMPLDIASRNGCAEVVEILIKHGADVAAKGPNGQTALHLAVENGHLRTIDLLINAGANLSARDKDGQTPLHVAALKGSIDIIELLVLRGADKEGRQKDGQTALHLAAVHNREDVVRWLLDHGVEQNAKDQDQSTALHLAARRGHERVITLLSEKRDNLLARDKYGQHPLIISAREDGRESIVRIMVERGADLAARDVSGRGALEYAALRGHDAVVRLLIENGAPLGNRDGFGRMALHYASMGGHATTVRLLIEKGVEIDAADKDGWTALHYASRIDCREVEQVLREAGADVLHRDRLGRTAEEYRADGGEANFWSRPLPPPYPE